MFNRKLNGNARGIITDKPKSEEFPSTMKQPEPTLLTGVWSSTSELVKTSEPESILFDPPKLNALRKRIEQINWINRNKLIDKLYKTRIWGLTKPIGPNWDNDPICLEDDCYDYDDHHDCYEDEYDDYTYDDHDDNYTLNETE